MKLFKPVLALAGVAAVGVLAVPVSAETYLIDPVHSSVSFKVRHLVVSKVQGQFDSFAGWFDYDPKTPTVWKASATIDAASINTRIEKRDTHLRSPAFFDAGKFPTLEFRSTGVEGVTASSATLKGTLTLHGVTKPVTLELEIGGVTKDPWGGTRAGFSASTTINRKDFGLTYNQLLEAGGAVVGNEVEISLSIEGTLKK